MEYLTLNNGVQMPLVGFGTFMLSGETCTQSVPCRQDGFSLDRYSTRVWQ